MLAIDSAVSRSENRSMEKNWLTFTVFLTLILGSIAEKCPLLHAPEGADRTGCYIIVLDSTIAPIKFAEILERATGLAEGNRVYGLVQNVSKAFTLKLSTESLNLLREIPEIKYIEEETMAEGSQIDIPYHLDRLDQRYLPLDGIFNPTRDGESVDIYILDTGITYNHEEFGNRAKFSGYDPMDDYQNENWRGGDCHGHGTHVASNAAGVKYGVAKKATLYSVRVLDCDNGAAVSVILSGMDHAMQMIAKRKRPAIVSISLGGRHSRSLNEAAEKLYRSGIPVVVSAGNDGLDACRYSPASAPNAITVGGSANGDGLGLYHFTNYGSCVDIFAPGASISGASRRCPDCSEVRSGTSFAAPLVSGAVALLLQRQPLLTPDEILTQLVSLSTKNTLYFTIIPRPYREFTPNRALYIGGVKVGFDKLSYTVAENEVLELCIMFRGPLKNDSFLELNISLLSDSAGSDDYSRMAVPNIITLNNTNKMECVSVNITDDKIVEGTERFYVQFSESKNNQIMISGNDTVPVYIVDNEAVSIGFEMARYSTEEAELTSPFTIRIVREDSLTAAQDYSVELLQKGDSTATYDEDFIISGGIPQIIQFGRFELTKEFDVTILDDNIGEGMELIILELRSVEDNMISVTSDQRTTEITIIEEDNSQTASVWNDRKFVAAVGSGTAAIIILLLLILAICLFVICHGHHKPNRLNKYGIEPTDHDVSQQVMEQVTK